MTLAYNSLSSDLLQDTSLQFQALNSSDDIINHQCGTYTFINYYCTFFNIFTCSIYHCIVLTYILYL